jgi:hypothetical protein
MGFDPDQENPGDWVKIKGASTAYGLYSNLYRYNGKIIVFDDCDRIFHDEDSSNILKAALDTSPKHIISWTSQATMGKNSILPKRFDFKGKVIFITNLEFKKIDSAVRSRAFLFDFILKTKDVLLLVKSKLKFLDPKVLTMESKEKAFEYLQNAADRGENIEISMRSLMQIAKVLQSPLPNKESMIKMLVKNFRKQ